MLTPFKLKVEYKKNPLGMDEAHPRFFYQLDGNGKKQLSRRITVTDPNGNTVWDSGEVQDSSTIQITYRGKRLKRFTCYHWQVTVKDDLGETAVSQEEAYFETGFLDTLWTAQWITNNDKVSNFGNPPAWIYSGVFRYSRNIFSFVNACYTAAITRRNSSAASFPDTSASSKPTI